MAVPGLGFRNYKGFRGLGFRVWTLFAWFLLEIDLKMPFRVLVEGKLEIRLNNAQHYPYTSPPVLDTQQHGIVILL